MIRDVVVAGGGTGALETALALRAHAPEHLRVHLVAPGRHFVRRVIAGAEARAARVALADAARAAGFGHVRDAVERVDALAHTVLTQGGDRHRYDALVLAVGGRPAAGLPGAITFRGPADLDRLRAALGRLAERRFGRPEVVVTAPPGGHPEAGHVSLWTLALLVRRLLPAAGRVIVAAPGGGPDDPALVRDLAAAGVELRSRTVPLLADEGRLVAVGGEPPLPADLVVTLPALQGPGLPGLPCDARGFVRVDAEGRVPGAPDVYAVGAMTGGPPAATLDGADAVARRIAAWAGAPDAAARPAGGPPRLDALLARAQPAEPRPAASAA